MPPQPRLTTQTTRRLHQSLLSIIDFTAKFDSVLLRSDTDAAIINTFFILLEGARLANQLFEDLVLFDVTDRERLAIPRIPFFRAGVNARAFVELYEAFNKECIEGNVQSKERMLERDGFWSFWHALLRSVRELVRSIE